MLNRTNRTLSATFNGLNLGTRTFAAARRADLNLAGLDHFRLGHPQRSVDASMRAGEICAAVPISISRMEPMSSYPPCSPRDPWRPERDVTVASRRGVAVEVLQRIGAFAAKRQAGPFGCGPKRGRDSSRFEFGAKSMPCAVRRSMESRPADRPDLAHAPGLNPASGRHAIDPAARYRAGGG